jgi:hypothetical protein
VPLKVSTTLPQMPDNVTSAVWLVWAKYSCKEAYLSNTSAAAHSTGSTETGALL